MMQDMNSSWRWYRMRPAEGKLFVHALPWSSIVLPGHGDRASGLGLARIPAYRLTEETSGIRAMDRQHMHHNDATSE